MAIHLQEMHPVMVHFPIALLPLAIGADIVGRMIGNERVVSFGKYAIVIAAFGAVDQNLTIALSYGFLVAIEEVPLEDGTARYWPSCGSAAVLLLRAARGNSSHRPEGFVVWPLSNRL